MATKEQEKPQKKRRTPASGRSTESEVKKVMAWRKERFTQILKDNGLTAEQIEPVIGKLVDSESSAHDLEGLIERKCDPETAIRILV